MPLGDALSAENRSRPGTVRSASAPRVVENGQLMSLSVGAELGRPQIHGYPLASIAFTSAAKRLQFVSGADEKIIRVFDTPRLWVQTLKTLSGVDAGDAVGSCALSASEERKADVLSR